MSHQILIIEDSADNRDLLSWILEDANYQMTFAATAEEGLEALQQSTIDLVLMDISLPGMDGVEATQTIRAMEGFQALPIIALTAHENKNEQDRIMASGVSGLLTKPIDEELLLQSIENFLGKPAS